jgi:diguanylate cyclase (GGDEF)-like protein
MKQTQPTTDRQRMTILAIEDNPISLKMMRTALEVEGYAVMEAANGKTALELMAKNAPDLILQDLMLPDVNGFDLVSKLRGLPGGEGIPILAMTGLFAKADEMRFADAPFTDYLFKPVEPSVLVATIHSYLPYNRTSAQKPGKKQRVLLVDDEPAQLKLFATYLSHLGFDVITATDGADGLVKARAACPDAILSDVLMPVMDGFHFCMKLRSEPELADTPVVLLSNYYEQEADKELARKVGAYALVGTAPDFREAIQALRQSLETEPLPAVDNEQSLAAAHQARLTHQLDRHAKLSAQLARRCAAQSAQISVLASIGESFLEGKVDSAALLSEILAHYLNVMGFSCGAVYLVEPKDRLALSAQVGFPEVAAKSLPNFFGHEKMLRDAMLKGEPVSISFSAKRNGSLSRLLSYLPTETLLINPLRFGNEALGVIVLISGTSPLESDWITFSKAITNQIGQVIALSRAISRLQYLTAYDSLTDLPNRAYLSNRIQEAITAENRVTLYLLNLDRFQEINNTLSYRNGNRLLRQISNRLDKAFSRRGVVARLGADEFALLLPLTTVEAVHRGAKQILKILEPLFRLDGLPIAVRASMGIAISPEHCEDADTLFSYADMARRAAKETGNDYLIYPDRVEPYSPHHLVMLAELREALEYDRLILFFQPKLSFQTGRTVSVEALLRWPHPNRGWIAPDLFIPLAEKAGVIHSLTLWVLTSALREAQLWRNAGLNIGVAVNVSARDLQDPTFPDFIEQVCRSTNTPRDALTLELTERALMSDPAKTDLAFQRLDELGVQFSIDDFGTGYSVLSYLQKLPVDEIKIDKSFVFGLVTDSRSEAIVRSIIDLGRNLGFRVVAEGVENQRTWERLAQLGCDAAQGYYMSRPLSPSDLPRWLKESPRGIESGCKPGGSV